jgi:hypothetical protein
MTEAEALDRYRALLSEHGIDVRRMSSKANVEKARAYLAWCDAREIDPSLYMRWRVTVEVERRGTPPGFKSLTSDDLGSEYLRTGAGASLAVYESSLKPVYDLVGRANARLYTLVRDAMQPPTPYEEHFRAQRAAAGQSSLCRIEKNRAGLGFDPRSPTCCSCSERIGCVADVRADEGFDIALLRRGEFGALSEPARTIAVHSTDLHTFVRKP